MAVFAVLLTGTVLNAQPCFLPGEDPKPGGQQWQLVKEMSDDFDGATLDHSKWQDEPVGNG